MIEHLHNGELQDPMGDSALIDPGPIPGETPLRKDQKANRQALIRSTPAPLTRNTKGKR